MIRVKVNVSGVLYEFDRRILDGREKETLAKMCDETTKSVTPLELFAGRPVECFAAILSYYLTDELHMPLTVCPKAFKKELEFWGVSPAILEPCCLYRYYTFVDECDTRERFRAESFDVATNDGDKIPVRTESKILRLRQTIWNIIDFQERTLRSKIYLAFMFSMVLLCIMTLAFSTTKAFHRNAKKCEMLEYLEHSEHDYYQSAFEQFGSPDCADDYYYDEEYFDYYRFEYNDTYGGSKIINLPSITVRLFVFDVLEYIAAGFFTVELLLRFGTCPSRRKFLKSIVNILDVLAVLAFYLQLLIVHIFMRHHKYQMSWIKAIGYLQLFRVMRLFRIAKNVRASRVLTFSLKSNAKDMILLVLMMLIVVSFFGSLIFFIENGQAIESIPEAWYWTVVTITTVGYGDITPKTAAGRFVAAILSICGVLLLSITLPIFVNNFLSLYQYASIDESIEVNKDKQQVGRMTGKKNKNHPSWNVLKIFRSLSILNIMRPARHMGIRLDYQIQYNCQTLLDCFSRNISIHVVFFFLCNV